MKENSVLGNKSLSKFFSLQTSLNKQPRGIKCTRQAKERIVKHKKCFLLFANY